MRANLPTALLLVSHLFFHRALTALSLSVSLCSSQCGNSCTGALQVTAKLTSSAAMPTGQETSFDFIELGDACYQTSLTVKGTADVKLAIMVQQLEDTCSQAPFEVANLSMSFVSLSTNAA